MTHIFRREFVFDTAAIIATCPVCGRKIEIYRGKPEILVEGDRSAGHRYGTDGLTIRTETRERNGDGDYEETIN